MSYLNNYHIIPIKIQIPSWLTEDRVFFFQLEKRPRYEALVEKNYKEIVHLANENGLQFIFHKYLAENINLMDNTIPDYDFLNEIANMDEQKFYDVLDWQIFSYQAIDPIYLVRRYNV